jgi:hypothetical protein
MEMSEQVSFKKMKEDRLYVKSNKGKKIELKNLDMIQQLEESDSFDEWTRIQINKINNITFKNNIVDVENKLIVSSVRLIKTSKLGRKVTPMIWEYYKNRGNLDVNQIIKQYGRDSLIINYSLCPKTKTQTHPHPCTDTIEIVMENENDNENDNKDKSVVKEDNQDIN